MNKSLYNLIRTPSAEDNRELHFFYPVIQICYFPLEERALASNPWDGIPGALLPSIPWFIIIPHPSDRIISLSFVVKMSEDTTLRFTHKYKTKLSPKQKSNYFIKMKSKGQLELCADSYPDRKPILRPLRPFLIYEKIGHHF